MERQRKLRESWTMIKRWVTGKQSEMDQDDIDRELFELARDWMEVSKLKKLSGQMGDNGSIFEIFIFLKLFLFFSSKICFSNFRFSGQSQPEGALIYTYHPALPIHITFRNSYKDYLNVIYN
jgi:hypothetical protein